MSIRRATADPEPTDDRVPRDRSDRDRPSAIAVAPATFSHGCPIRLRNLVDEANAAMVDPGGT